MSYVKNNDYRNLPFCAETPFVGVCFLFKILLCLPKLFANLTYFFTFPGKLLHIF